MTCPPDRNDRPPKRPWSPGQIRRARAAHLPALLAARGLHLREQGAGNIRIAEHPGIVVKDSFWNDPENERSGNAIDFFVHVLGLSFAQAMREIDPN